MRPANVPMEDRLYPSQANGHHRHPEAGGNQADARLKRLNLARPSSLSFGKKQDGPIVVDQIPDIAQRLADTSLGLRNRERVEEQGYERIQEAIPEPLIGRVTFRAKMRIEILLPHCGGHTVPVTCRQGRQNQRRIQVALVVRCKNDGSPQ